MTWEDASPWLWLATPSRCVWNSKPSIENSPWPSRKQTVSDTRAQHALDADGDLRLVGALDEDAPAGGLDDGGVVEADTLAARELRLLVGIDGEDREQRIAPAHHLQDVARALPDGILGAVEIGDADRCPQLIDHRHRGGRRRVDLLPGEVDVRVVEDAARRSPAPTRRARRRRSPPHRALPAMAPRPVASGSRSPIANSTSTATSQPAAHNSAWSSTA